MRAGVGRLLVAIGLVASIVGLLAAWPSLNASALEPIRPTRSRVSVTIDGLVPLNDFRVECRGNKVVFADRFTLKANGYVTIDQYSVDRFGVDDTLELECAQPWALYTTPAEGVFVFGDMDREHPPAVIELNIRPTGDVTMKRPPGSPPQSPWLDTTQYESHPITGIDASLIVSYRLPWYLLNLEQSKSIHLIANDRGGGLMWRVTPDKEPPLPDADTGLIVENSGTAIRATATGRFRRRP